MTTATLTRPVESPPEAVSTPPSPPSPRRKERPDPAVALAELEGLKQGQDYTGKMELVGRGRFYIWHRDFRSEVSRAQAVMDAQLKGGVTFFDVTGGLDHATKVTAIGADTEELMGVSPLVGG